MWRALRLSQNKIGGFGTATRRSLRRKVSHASSVCCGPLLYIHLLYWIWRWYYIFLILRNKIISKEGPKECGRPSSSKTAYPITSEKAHRSSAMQEVKLRSRWIVPLMYRKMRRTIFRCAMAGVCMNGEAN